jgi:hypothetical protein
MAVKGFITFAPALASIYFYLRSNHTKLFMPNVGLALFEIFYEFTQVYM